MNKQEIYEAIVNWQMDAGEDFLDYFDGDLRAVSFMMWCRGKGYLTIDQFNLWEEAMNNDNDEAEQATSIVHNCHGDNIPYAVVSEEDWTEVGQEKAYMILAEFISESIIYQKRFKEFLKEN